MYSFIFCLYSKFASCFSLLPFPSFSLSRSFSHPPSQVSLCLLLSPVAQPGCVALLVSISGFLTQFITFFPVWNDLVLHLFVSSLYVFTQLTISLPCYFCIAGHIDQILFVPTAFCGSLLRALVKLEQHTLLLPLSAPSSPLFYHCLFLNQIFPIFSQFHIFNAYKPVLYSAKFQECYSESSREIIGSEDKICLHRCWILPGFQQPDLWR